MKIKMEVELNIERCKQGYFVYDRETLHQLMGASSVSSNLQMYPGVKKERFKGVLGWYVKRNVLLNRINELIERKRKLEDKLKFMTSVTGVKNGTKNKTKYNKK